MAKVILIVISLVISVPAYPQSRYFDGTDDKIITGFSPGTAIGSFNSWTVEFWFKQTKAEFTAVGILFGCANTAGALHEDRFYFQAGDTIGKWFVGLGNTQPMYNQSIGSTINGMWQHLAFVYHSTMSVGSPNTNRLEAYVNGKCTWALANINCTNRYTTAVAWVGGYNVLSYLYLPGQIDEIKVWNVARSTAQINYDMNICGAGANKSEGLVFYYSLNETAGNVRDWSNNSANSTSVTGTTTRDNCPAKDTLAGEQH